MTFTQQLPTKPGSYPYLEDADGPIELVEFAISQDLKLRSHKGSGKPPKQFTGLWGNGPLLSPEDEATLLEQIEGRDGAFEKMREQTDARISELESELVALKATTVPRDVFAKEVEAAYNEGFMSTARPLPCDYSNSRACRVAAGKEGM